MLKNKNVYHKYEHSIVAGIPHVRKVIFLERESYELRIDEAIQLRSPGSILSVQYCPQLLSFSKKLG